MNTPLGLFSGDTNGDNVVNLTDSGNLFNFHINNKPILSIFGIENTISQNNKTITSIIDLKHTLKLQPPSFHNSFRYRVKAIINNDGNIINENYRYFTISHPNNELEKNHELTYTTIEGSDVFSELTTISFQIVYSISQLHDPGTYFKMPFYFITPPFTIDQGFDLAPGFSSVNYEHNATLISRIDNVSIQDGDIIAAYDENNEIHSYESLQLAKNSPQLDGNNYYFAGAIGVDTPVQMSYKYWDNTAETLHDLVYSSGADPTLVEPNSIIGTPSNPVVFEIV